VATAAAKVILGIDNNGLAVRDLARSVASYEKLGFLKAYENERGCGMSAGSAKLYLFKVVPGSAAHRTVHLRSNKILPGLITSVSLWTTLTVHTQRLNRAAFRLWPLRRTNPGELEPLSCAILMGIISIS
jgi:hypothetical protein